LYIHNVYTNCFCGNWALPLAIGDKFAILRRAMSQLKSYFNTTLLYSVLLFSLGGGGTLFAQGKTVQHKTAQDKTTQNKTAQSKTAQGRTTANATNSAKQNPANINTTAGTKAQNSAGTNKPNSAGIKAPNSAGAKAPDFVVLTVPDSTGIKIIESQIIPPKLGYATHKDRPTIILNPDGGIKYFADGTVLYQNDYSRRGVGWSKTETLMLSDYDDLWKADRDTLYLLIFGADPKQPARGESYENFIQNKSSTQLWIIRALVAEEIKSGQKIEYGDKFLDNFEKQLRGKNLRIDPKTKKLGRAVKRPQQHNVKRQPQQPSRQR
jgi:hypothetical protein